MFAELPEKPDHDSLERGILELWESQRTFDQLRQMNAGGPRFSFIDGPVTANKTLGACTPRGAGRSRTCSSATRRCAATTSATRTASTAKVSGSRSASSGSSASTRSGRSRSTGWPRSRAKCREVVERSSAELTKGSIRLGQWMDWGNDYFTFSDTNIEYIWRFLSIVHDRGWLYRGPPRHGVVPALWHVDLGPRAGRQLRRPGRPVLLGAASRSLDRTGEAIVIWTTTPWTLPANVAAAVNPAADYGRLPNGDWRAVGQCPDGATPSRWSRGASWWACAIEGPFDGLGPGAARRPRRDRVGRRVDRGGHRGSCTSRPGAARRTSSWVGSTTCPCSCRSTSPGASCRSTAGSPGGARTRWRADIIADLRTRGLLVDAGTITHRYPECWRCHTPLIFRISDDWFISRRRDPRADA